MSFSDTEISDQDGRPVALYKLEWGNTIWRYTSADQDITYDEPTGVGDATVSVTYTAVAISDAGMTQGGSNQNDMTVTMPSDLPVVSLYRGTPPSLPVWLTIRRLHFGDTEAAIYWIGTLSAVGRPDLATAAVTAIPITATFERAGLRLGWTRGCPRVLYDKGCTIDRDAFMVAAHISAISGNTVTITFDVPPSVEVSSGGYFDGGFMEWIANADNTIDRRGISASTTSDPTLLNIFGFTDGLSVGLALKLYPGCDRTSQTCEEKFNNLANYGGFDFMAEESPFNINVFL